MFDERVTGEPGSGTSEERDESAAPGDAGRTSGGGSLGHDQPEDVTAETHLRNQGGERKKTGGLRETVKAADD
jgi:hypothetical protein